MCLCIYLHIYTWKLHVCGYIFTYMYTKLTGVFMPSLHVCVHIFTYMYAQSTFECTCVHLYIYVWKDTMCACKMCVYKYRHTCLCLYLVYGCVLYVCIGIYICIGMHERPHGRIQIHCVRIGIHLYVSVFVRVGVCIHMYRYIYEKTPCTHTNLHMRVYTLAYMHADFTCGCIHV